MIHFKIIALSNYNPFKLQIQPVEEDQSTIPLNEINLKLTVDTKHEGGHYYKVKYDWFHIGSTSSDGLRQQIDKTVLESGFMKDWSLIQIEGEEPVEQQPVEDAKVITKGKAPAAKGAAAKVATGVLEEINDNRPRIIQLVKNFGEESGPIKVTEDIAKYFENFIMKFELWKTERETQEDKL